MYLQISTDKYIAPNYDLLFGGFFLITFGCISLASDFARSALSVRSHLKSVGI